ncbi:putative nucleoside-diphosphate-sugar epimerase [Agrilactobacillus composti DSM 18527 = JCM 14202]|nr:NmrA family NAD(P)-binding protein [Agrilactobacillus composti]GAF40279.1 putative nucleoside-diphosphate-sugar epimerase [Agrilactobacillus composti DSM 18527 = JCM 14202]
MFLVTSAAGHTGTIITQALVNAGYDVLATDINPRVKDLPGIKAAKVGDLTNLDFLKDLLTDVDQIAYIPPLFSPEEALIGQTLVDLAIANHVQQFIFISVTHPILHTLLQHVAKRDVEEHLIYQGMAHSLTYTILQPMHYMHNFNPKQVQQDLTYGIFYDIHAKVAYVDPEDVAAVVVKVAQKPAFHDKATYELVGTQAYSPVELVAQFNALTGLQAQAKYVPVTQFLDQIQATDLYFRAGFQQLADSYSRWGLDGNPNVLRYLLGREPTSFTAYLKRELQS